MINQTGFVGMSDTIPSAVGTKTDERDLGFEELLLEKTFPSCEKALGIISDRLGSVYNIDLLTDVTEHIIKTAMSLGEDGRSIWDIVLQLEESADPRLLDEKIDMDFDDTAGLNSVAGFLARFWKKKELLEENGTVFLYPRNHNVIANQAAFELAALLKNKDQKLIAEVHE